MRVTLYFLLRKINNNNICLLFDESVLCYNNILSYAFLFFFFALLIDLKNIKTENTERLRSNLEMKNFKVGFKIYDPKNVLLVI